MSLEPWRIARIIKIQDETSNTRRFWFEVPELNVFDFKPGQFVTLDLPINEKANKRWRSYSIASWPDATNIFELIIVLDQTGAGTPYLFHVEVGTEINFRGPQGVFNLREPMDKDIFMVCTGTGIAPFRSMIHYIKNAKLEYKNLYLIFGCRTKESLLYYDEFLNLAEAMSSFKYIPTLSRQQWDGNTGYVHEVYETLCKERQPAGFFLCGWKGMVDESRKRILEMGYDKKDIHLEIYG